MTEEITPPWEEEQPIGTQPIADVSLHVDDQVAIFASDPSSDGTQARVYFGEFGYRQACLWISRGAAERLKVQLDKAIALLPEPGTDEEQGS